MFMATVTGHTWPNSGAKGSKGVPSALTRYGSVPIRWPSAVLRNSGGTEEGSRPQALVAAPRAASEWSECLLAAGQSCVRGVPNPARMVGAAPRGALGAPVEGAPAVH